MHLATRFAIDLERGGIRHNRAAEMNTDATATGGVKIGGGYLLTLDGAAGYRDIPLKLHPPRPQLELFPKT
jgi:hypothetical protein